MMATRRNRPGTDFEEQNKEDPARGDRANIRDETERPDGETIL